MASISYTTQKPPQFILSILDIWIKFGFRKISFVELRVKHGFDKRDHRSANRKSSGQRGARSTVQNLFNSKIINGVYAFSGLPNDDGYLSSPEGQQKISQEVSQQSFIDLYNISVNNPFNYAAPRLMRLGVRFTL